MSQILSSGFPLINAVLNKQQQGLVYQFHNGGRFISHKAGFSQYLQSSNHNDGRLFFDYIMQTQAVPVYFHLYDATATVINICEAQKEKVNTRLRKRCQLQYKNSQPFAVIACPAGYYLQTINSDNFSSLNAFRLSLPDKFWASEKDFLENGFGYCVFSSNGAPASICYAACVSNGIAEIDVATLPQYQQQGLARVAVAAFVQHCISKQIIANWDCFEENTASLKTASGLGFTAVHEYLLLSIFNKTKQE